MLEKNLYVSELNEDMFEMVRNACIDALEELGEIEMLEDALSGRLCDLDALINIDEILK